MASATEPGAKIGVQDYRALIAQRLEEEGVVDESGLVLIELIFNLTRLHNRLSLYLEGVHRPRGWTWAGYRIMNVLWALGPVELRDIARLSGASRASISSVVNTLERDGLVIRTRDAEDGRLVRVGLTERGRQELRDGMREQADSERQWFAILDATEQRKLAALLAIVADQPSLGG